jgi:2-oxoglutarate ferredoxin oxidoreductase subunit gamma
MDSGKKYKIRICGSGGMGIVFSSIMLGNAALIDNKNVIQTQSYGPEQRSTVVKGDIIISEEQEVEFPIFRNANILVGLSQRAFEQYYRFLENDGTIFINSDAIQSNGNIVYSIPASSMALELNNKIVANMIILGFFVYTTQIVSKASIIKSISKLSPLHHKEVNILAFLKGYEYSSLYFT